MKDPVAAPWQAGVVYRYDCKCKQFYVGQTKRRLMERMKEHKKDKKSAVHQHAEKCGFNESGFRVVGHFTAHQLRKAEALIVRKLQPTICKQREMVKSLSLPWPKAQCPKSGPQSQDCPKETHIASVHTTLPPRVDLDEEKSANVTKPPAKRRCNEATRQRGRPSKLAAVTSTPITAFFGPGD